MEETITTKSSSQTQSNLVEENQIYAIDYVESKQMANTTKEKLGEFVRYESLTEWTKMAHEGKKMFYDFIREAYAQGNIYVAWEEFSTIVKDLNADLSEELVKDYFKKYQKGIELLLLAL